MRYLELTIFLLFSVVNITAMEDKNPDFDFKAELTAILNSSEFRTLQNFGDAAQEAEAPGGVIVIDDRGRRYTTTLRPYHISALIKKLKDLKEKLS